ncbi:hypothetical protein C8R47DRAFT_961890, partial [Mycena vitilis]
AYNRYLRDLIISGRAKPGFVVSHNVSLDDAADAYVKFDKRIVASLSGLNGWKMIPCTFLYVS